MSPVFSADIGIVINTMATCTIVYELSSPSIDTSFRGDGKDVTTALGLCVGV